jgi:hypothetical protein
MGMSSLMDAYLGDETQNIEIKILYKSDKKSLSNIVDKLFFCLQRIVQNAAYTVIISFSLSANSSSIFFENLSVSF